MGNAPRRYSVQRYTSSPPSTPAAGGPAYYPPPPFPPSSASAPNFHSPASRQSLPRSPHDHSSTHGHHHSHPQQQQQQQHVQCPRCLRTLIQPNAPQFFCPCGQLLARPSPLRVRCPRCSSILEPPPGARVFACRCGINLRAPDSASARTLNVNGGGGPGSLSSSGLSTASAAMESKMLKISTQGTAGQWRRRKVASDKIGWYKIWTEEEEAMVFEAESALAAALKTDPASALEGLSVGQIRERLQLLGIPSNDCLEKSDLVRRVQSGPEELVKRRTVEELRELFERHGLDYKSCKTRQDLATRYFLYVWSEHKTVAGVQHKGFVRRFADNGRLDWVPATSYSISVRLETDAPGANPTYSASAILIVSQQSYKQKCEWVKQQFGLMKIKWDAGHVKLRIRRSHILEDAFNNFQKLKVADFRRHFRYEFINEPGLDAGGVAREFYSLVLDLCFNVDFGLFEYGGTDNVCYQISPLSGTANELHLEYFRFLGLLLGKALLDGHLFTPHLTRVFYKHLLAWPVSETDVEFVDSQVASSIKSIRECEDVSLLCLDFTTAVHAFGETRVVELKPGGKDIEVTNENRDEYLELLVKHICLDRVSPQMRQFLEGVYDVVPLPLLSIFNFSELEFLLCGLPDVDVEDWMANTRYKGEYAALGANHPVVKMFWEVMRASNAEQRARFLQFATGTSRVPVQGFAALQGNDGDVKPFTIDSIALTESVFPRAHTCFNRVDIPPYSSKEEMIYRFAQAMELEGQGFAIE